MAKKKKNDYEAWCNHLQGPVCKCRRQGAMHKLRAKRKHASEYHLAWTGGAGKAGLREPGDQTTEEFRRAGEATALDVRLR